MTRLSDLQISTALYPLRPITSRKVPVVGRWGPPPYLPRCVEGRALAVVCGDDLAESVVVDRETGEVLLIDMDGQLVLINDSLDRFVDCARLYERFLRIADRTDGGEAASALIARALVRLQEIDSRAVGETGQLWVTAVTETRIRGCRVGW